MSRWRTILSWEVEPDEVQYEEFLQRAKPGDIWELRVPMYHYWVWFQSRLRRDGTGIDFDGNEGASLEEVLRYADESSTVGCSESYRQDKQVVRFVTNIL